MKQVLSQNECSLLQRYYDGDSLAQPDAGRVEQLLNGSTSARVFMAALEELTLAMHGAEQALWDNASPPTIDTVVEMAFNASKLADASLEDLAPLLERFFDGEVMGAEMAAVQALINERDDVADYLAELDGLRSSVLASHEQLMGGVSFDGFWDSISDRLPDEAPAVETIESDFDAEEHRVLVYRYFDDEVSTEERAQVDAWLASGEASVVATIAALCEIRLATVTAIESAQERVDLSTLWHGIEDALDQEVEAQGENVVSFARKKRQRETNWGDSRSIALVAIAAMLFMAFGAGIFKDQLFGTTERVVVEKTVVIVDSVEYEPGSSVMVNTPMRPVSSISAAGEPGVQTEEEPTVIWLLDSAPAEGADEDQNADETPGKAKETSDQPI